MNDYNRGALPDPCLRLDYGFGEQWASVELGDGTGYVRLADYEKLESENAELRDTTYAWSMVDRLSCENAKLLETCFDAHRWMGRALYDGSARRYEYESITERMRELGIEVYE